MNAKLNRLYSVAATVVLLLGWATNAGAQTVGYTFNGHATARYGPESLIGEAGLNATYIRSPESQGVLPAPGEFAVNVPLPQGFWNSSGTLSFFISPTRTIRSGGDKKAGSLKTRLAETPMLNIDIKESSSQVALEIELLGQDGAKHKSRMLLSHLKGGQWYHLAVAWSAPENKLEAYLNGFLQERLISKPPLKEWNPIERPSGWVTLGGTFGEGDRAAAFAVDSLQVSRRFMTEDMVRMSLKGRGTLRLSGEGRTPLLGQMSFFAHDTELIYQADFSKSLSVVSENELFENGKRVRRPEGAEWVLEGPGKAWTENGQLHLQSKKPKQGGHVVLWNTRKFPENCVVEFYMSPTNSNNGLNIVFFGAMARDGKDIFDLSLPKRDGVFKNYHSGALDAYHISYWACNPENGGTPRRTANIRKNHGFNLLACGTDHIAGQGAGPHHVRVLKMNGAITLETRDKLAGAVFDSGKTHGPVLKDGYVGLRQMGHTDLASYTGFSVWKVTKRKITTPPPPKFPPPGAGGPPAP